MRAGWVPSAFTIINLLGGVFSLVFTINQQYTLAAAMILVSLVADGLDGRVARKLKVASEFGKQMDSLADVVAFGVAPALFMFAVNLKYYGILGWLVAFAFPICGALRLARFNLQTGGKGYFTGLPITSAGTIMATFVLYGKNLDSPIFLFAMAFISYLMVSTIKYPDFKKFDRHMIKPAYALGLCIILAVIAYFDPYILIFLPLVAYAAYGVLNQLWLAFMRKTS